MMHRLSPFDRLWLDTIAHEKGRRKRAGLQEIPQCRGARFELTEAGRKALEESEIIDGSDGWTGEDGG